LSAQIIKQTPDDQTGAQPTTAESLGWQLRAALPPLKLHSVSLYDPAGEVLWLSEGALGPDEQAFVVEALRELEGRSTGHHERDFGDGRAAVFLAVRSPQAELVGLVMVLVDVKALASGGLAARVLSAPVRALLQRLAILLRPPSRSAPAAPAAAHGRIAAHADPAANSGSSSATAIRSLEILEWAPPKPNEAPGERDASGAHVLPLPQVESSGGDANQTTEERLAPQAAEAVLTFELSEPKPIPSRSSNAPTARVAGELHIQELTKLRPGGRMRRFRVVPKPPLTPEQSLFAPLRELGAWLAAHPEAREGASLNFSVVVSAGALADDNLPQALSETVGSSGIEPACLGFDLAESVYVRDKERADRVVRAIEELGCFLVLDDFTFDTGALELLRSRALRLVKVDGALTRGALRDKLAQARVVAISQAARVLGVHCAAKQIDTAATNRWLAAAGFDFAEGPLFGAPRALASLASELADHK
jgi:EAL domain-containing protein (putative c-di-GMP-specific phosphodiesterase class I)